MNKIPSGPKVRVSSKIRMRPEDSPLMEKLNISINDKPPSVPNDLRVIKKETKPIQYEPKPKSKPMGFATKAIELELEPAINDSNDKEKDGELEVVYHDGRELSKYQLKIRRHIHRINKRTKRPHFVCPSVAGSGKSWSLKMCVREIVRLYPKDKVLVLQFNTHIADATRAALGPLGNVEVKTNHGAGVAVLNLNGYRCRVEKSKMFAICKSVVEKNYGAISGANDKACRMSESLDEDNESGMELEAEEVSVNGKGGKKKETKSRKIMAWTVSLTEITEMCQQTLTDPSSLPALKAMIERQEMNIRSMILLNYVNQCIDIGIEQFRKLRIISFTEMLYLPVVLDMKFPKYDWVLCDESQDFNAAQMEIVFNHLADTGRIGAFGDERQSIMMWAGAMPDSMEKYIKRSNARNMPLSVCYRCPSSVLDLARLIVPHVENRDNCPEGSVETIKFWKIKDVAKAGDYILCRLTAPLVSMCIEFIKSNIRAKVKGRDIGTKLKSLYEDVVDSAKGKVNTVSDFLGLLKDYAQAERISMAAKKTSQAKIIQMEDSFAALKAIGEYLSGKRKGEYHGKIKEQIGWMFDEAVPEDFITLCTVHRAKGLETNNVFIIDFHRIPFKPGQGQKEVSYSKESLTQEMNLMYVALTRPIEKLYICGQNMDSMDDVRAHIKNWVHIKNELENGGEFKFDGNVSSPSSETSVNGKSSDKGYENLVEINRNPYPKAFHQIEPDTKQDSDPDFN